MVQLSAPNTREFTQSLISQENDPQVHQESNSDLIILSPPAS